MKRPASALLALLLLAGCGSADDTAASEDAAESSDTPASTTPTSSPVESSTSAPSELGIITDSGLGQRDEYVWVTAVVRNNSEYVGQTVTVNFNVLDADGAILASQAQVENFSRPAAEHIVGTQIDLSPGETAASVEASLLVEPAGAFSDQPFPEIPAANYSIGTDEFGAPQVAFELTNPLPEPLSSPRVGIVCRDEGGAIIGGGTEYPEVIPADGTIRVDPYLIVTSTPDTCTAVVGAPSDWAGAGEALGDSAGSAPEETVSASLSPEAAFEVWLGQFAAQDWDAQYDTLLPAQQELISRSEYASCRADEVADIEWLRTLSVQDIEAFAVPGTNDQLPATKVTVEVSFNGLTTPVDAHMFLTDEQWRWTMTQENLDNCG